MVRNSNEIESTKGHWGWMVTIAGSLFALIMSVFLVGWNARGQTAKITAVELKTDNLKIEFVKHNEKQEVQTKEFDKTLQKQNIVLTEINASLKKP